MTFLLIRQTVSAVAPCRTYGTGVHNWCRLPLARRAEGTDSPPIESGVMRLVDQGREDYQRVQSMRKAWPNNRLQVTADSVRFAPAARRT